MTPKQEKQIEAFLGALHDLFHEIGDDRQYIIRDMIDKPNHNYRLPHRDSGIESPVYAMLHAMSATESSPIGYEYDLSYISRPTRIHRRHINVTFLVREINHPSLAYTWKADRNGRHVICEYCERPIDYFASLTHLDLDPRELCPVCHGPRKMRMRP